MNRDMIKNYKNYKRICKKTKKIELTEFEGRASGCVVIMQGNAD